MNEFDKIESIFNDLCDVVAHFAGEIEYQDYCVKGDSPYDYNIDDLVVLYREEGKPCFEVVHSGIIENHKGRIAVCPLYSLLISDGHGGEPYEDKIERFFYSFFSDEIPLKVIRAARALEITSIEWDHTGSDGVLYYEAGPYVIKYLNQKCSIYKWIHSQKKADIPYEVLDFLYPSKEEYTRVRYIGAYRHYDVYYPCHEDDIYTDFVDKLLCYDPLIMKFKWIKGHDAFVLYHTLEKKSKE